MNRFLYCIIVVGVLLFATMQGNAMSPLSYCTQGQLALSFKAKAHEPRSKDVFTSQRAWGIEERTATFSTDKSSPQVLQLRRF